MWKVNEETLCGIKTCKQSVTDECKGDRHHPSEKSLLPVKVNVDDRDQNTGNNHHDVEEADETWIWKHELPFCVKWWIFYEFKHTKPVPKN